MKKLYILFFTLFLCTTTSALAIGIRSNNLITDIYFKPGFHGTYEFILVPSNGEPMDIEVYVQNGAGDDTITDVTGYFSPTQKIIKNVVEGREYPFSVYVSLPNKIEEPGTHKVTVGVREMPSSSGGIAVRSAVEAIFFLRVPYEGKYLRYYLDASSVNFGEPIVGSIRLTSLGTSTIEKITTNIDMLNSEQKIVAHRTIETTMLNSAESRTIPFEIPTLSLFPGKYLLNATIKYDGETSLTNKSVKIGQLNFAIINHTATITSGKINEIEIVVESEWADLVKNVFADIKIGELPLIKTITQDVTGFQTAYLKGFVDATELDPGTYDMNINLYFENEKITKQTKIQVIREKVDLNMTTGTLFLIVVLIIITINIALFFALLKKKNEHDWQK